MKAFGLGVAILSILALQGCYTNPSVSKGGSIEEFSRSLNGTRYSFDQTGTLTPETWNRTRSGVLLTDQKIPAGLIIALTPAWEHCKLAGGAASFSNLKRSERGGNLPQRVLCTRDQAPLWALEILYVDLAVKPSRELPYNLEMTLRTELVSPEQYAARRQAEQELEQAQAQARNQAAAVLRERQAALEQEYQQRVRAQESEARRLAAERSARVAAFQASLKAGDRFQWVRPPRGISGPVVGMVVRVEGSMAFTQLDNLTISGNFTRYIPTVELEPFDGPIPTSRWSID